MEAIDEPVYTVFDISTPGKVPDIETLINIIENLKDDVRSLRDEVEEVNALRCRDIAAIGAQLAILKEQFSTNNNTAQKGCNVGQITHERLNKLDKVLLQHGMKSFSDISKCLELGTKSTRRQNMTQFSKVLLTMPDRYEIQVSKHSNQKYVRLVPSYLRHLNKSGVVWDID